MGRRRQGGRAAGVCTLNFLFHLNLFLRLDRRRRLSLSLAFSLVAAAAACSRVQYFLFIYPSSRIQKEGKKKLAIPFHQCIKAESVSPRHR
jgi:hypothetical protein